MVMVELGDVASNVEHRPGGPHWLRSTRCEHANCVEVSFGTDVLMRNSALPDEPSLIVAPDAWRDFIAAVKNGDFDL